MERDEVDSLDRDLFYKAALTFAKQHGWDRDELPRGDRANPHTCPLALAVPGWQLKRNLPTAVWGFVLSFDAGQYPELIADND